MVSEEYPIQKESLEEKFIPFLQERDSLGRLLPSPPKTHPNTAHSTRSVRNNSVSIHKRFKLVSPSKVIRERSISPSVGSYYKPNSWIKPTFSHFKLKPKRLEETPETKQTVENSDTEILKQSSLLKRNKSHSDISKKPFLKLKHRRSYVYKDIPSTGSYSKFDMLKPEFFLRKTYSTQFSSLKIQGNPSQIADSLKGSHFRELKEKMVNEIKKITMKQVKKYASLYN